MTGSRSGGRAGRATVSIALLLAAGVAVASAPDADQIVAPFRVDGAVGDDVYSRTMVVRVDDVSLAQQVDAAYATSTSSDGGPLSTEGVWVVVDTTVSSRIGSLTLNRVEMLIGDVRYRVYGSLPDPALTLLPYGAGVPMSGPLIFELPAGALEDPGAADADILFLPSIEAQLDTVADIRVDLTALPIERRVTLDEARVVDAR